MHIVNNIKTFLYDKNYFINIYENKIHVYSYVDLLKLSETEIVLKFEDFDLDLIGRDMHITKMAERELMVEGIIDSMRFTR